MVEGMSEHATLSSLGRVDVKVSKSTQGVSLEVDVQRPREPGETFEQAACHAAGLAATTYALALDQIAALGLVPGKAEKGA